MALTTQEMLDEAREAYHALLTGQAVAEIRDQNGETVRYAKADLSKLALYIASLEREIAGSAVSGPMRIMI